MNLTDKNLDNRFKDAATRSKSPEYKEDYWNEFESILNAEQKKKGGLWIWFSAGTVIFTLLSSLLFTGSDSVHFAAIEKSSTLGQKKSQHFSSEKQTNTSSIKNNFSSQNKTATLEKMHSKSTLIKNSVEQNGLNLAPSSSSELLKNSESYNANNPKKESVKTTKEVTEILPIHTQDLPVISKQLKNKQLVDPKIKSKKGWNIYSQLNLGIAEAYNTNILGRSYTTDVSLNVEHKFETLVLRTGLGIAATTNSAIAYTDRSKVYGYSSNTYSHHIVFDNLYEVYVPLELGVEVKGYSFGAGLSARYLLSNTLHFTSTENNQIVINEDYQNIREGLNDFSLSGHVFVDKALTSQISVGAKAGTLLTDRYSKENVFEFGENRKNPLFGQLYIKLNF
ncbi:MAG: hypothetical protein ACPGU5_03410 [Lishizhenia sp.]